MVTSLPLKLAGSNGAAIKHQAGKVHARQSHGGGGDGFVATDNADHGVKELAAADQLDGVGNHFAAYQRGAHALGAHGFAVG